MIFLLEYDRQHRIVIELHRFQDSEFQTASKLKASKQVEAAESNLDRDIVLFTADSEEDLRRTHGSYFLTASQLIDRMEDSVGAIRRHRERPRGAVHVREEGDDYKSG